MDSHGLHPELLIALVTMTMVVLMAIASGYSSSLQRVSNNEHIFTVLASVEEFSSFPHANQC